MSRPIKFRAWHTKRHEMIRPTPGVPQYWHEQDLFAAAAMGEPIILMQFTGLLDKNGREIYEGDVVTFRGFSSSLSGRSKHDSVGEVTLTKYGTWVIKGQEGCQKEMPFEHKFTGENKEREDEEIIGNIYEDNS